MEAAGKGHLPVVVLLLDRGANKEATDNVNPPFAPTDTLALRVGVRECACVCVCTRVRVCVSACVCVHLCILYTALEMNWMHRVSCSTNLSCRMGIQRWTWLVKGATLLWWRS
jgi:hypothetical protein